MSFEMFLLMKYRDLNKDNASFACFTEWQDTLTVDDWVNYGNKFAISIFEENILNIKGGSM